MTRCVLVATYNTCTWTRIGMRYTWKDSVNCSVDLLWKVVVQCHVFETMYIVVLARGIQQSMYVTGSNV